MLTLRSRNLTKASTNAAVAIIVAIIAGPYVLALGLSWLGGACVAEIVDRKGPSLAKPLVRAWRLSSLPMLALAMIGSVAARESITIQMLATTAVALASCSLLWALSSSQALPKPLGYVSNCADWSYSLYALHCPFMVFFAAFIVPNSRDRWHLNLINLGAAGLVVILVGLIARMAAALTEMQTSRARRWIRRQDPIARVRSIGASKALT
jgi:peptidoglycan/LPS O-acetylase OafA/YrhL